MIEDCQRQLSDDWKGLYREGWKGEIVEDAFSHPAKYARALIRKIYDHATAEGWLNPGDTVIDPFGGVGLGALDAMKAGLNWVGVELEKRFQILGQGMDCPGFDKSFWRRYQGRGAKWLKLGVCPDCGHRLNAGSPFVNWFGSIVRVIPSREAHRYQGNIEIWENRYQPSGTGKLLQGDSRELGEVIEQAGVCVSSPPYADAGMNQGKDGIDWSKTNGNGRTPGRGAIADGYGVTPGQLGAMKAGNLDAAISSPPFLQASGGVNITSESGPLSDPALIARHVAGNASSRAYGDSPANLGNLKPGSFDAAISSPPFENGLPQQDRSFTAPHDSTRNLQDAVYGSTPGQLGNLKAGDFDAAVSSPPYTGSQQVDNRESPASAMSLTWRKRFGEITDGQDPDNLANCADFWTAARQIVEQTYAVLRPGGHAIWVVKAFVKEKTLVDFPGQWRALCEAVGFQTLHEHRAWVIEDRGTQIDLFGNGHKKTVERKSFFRRLAEKKGSPRIDYEGILCMQKGVKI